MLTAPKVNDTVYYIDPWIRPTIQMGKIVAVVETGKRHLIIDWIYPKNSLAYHQTMEDLFSSPVDATHTYLEKIKRDLDNQVLQMLDEFSLGD